MRTTVKDLEVRVNKIEDMITQQNQMLEKMMSMLGGTNNTTQTTKAKASKTATTKASKEAEREAQKTEFKNTHKLVASSQENKAKVYAEMEKQGIKEFNRKDYERIAKELGVLGKSGKVVATWEEIA